ncbi:MAG: aminodeoxychorismate synthase component I, partial [Thermodesulfobacteriota bacterium]|nr:aminodeoxychorismate synthase component I [Thermodesulfobacteriota bacterium]
MERVEFHQPFEVIAEQFAGDKGTAVLLSGTDLDCARYHILAARPWLTMVGKGENLTINSRGEEFKFNGDPLECIARVTEHFKIMKPEVMDTDALKPVSAGLFGYFAYDLKDSIERLPRTCIDHGLPDLFLFSPSIILLFDKIKEDFHLSIPVIPSIYSGETAANRVERVRTLFFKKVSVFNSSAKKNFFHGLIKDSSGLGASAEDCIKKKNGTRSSEKDFMIESSGLKSNFSKPEYINAVEKIIEYIKAGDIYQVNLSQRFTAQFKGDSYSLFLECFKKNPAPFFAFINADDHQIISTSPERFIKRDGEKIETRPIKGTLPRGQDPLEDKKLAEKLLKSFKDDAELSMIVDLMRNDFGKVAKGGTVRVKEHKMLEPYDNVFHLVSVVTALLDKDKTSIDLIKAAFPGGSITGCPKIRAMEIIDELESVKRHIYTGSIGYLSFHNTMDLSIAIRTATVFHKELSFSVGGGIVYDSDP